MNKQAYFKMMGLDKQAQVDPNVIKNILIGTGAGLGTYALSSFLPGARQNRLARLLASLGVGLGTGYFGTDIRNWFSNKSGKKPAAPAVSSADAQAAIQGLKMVPGLPGSMKTPAQVAAAAAEAGATLTPEKIAATQAAIQGLKMVPGLPGSMKTPAQAFLTPAASDKAPASAEAALAKVKEAFGNPLMDLVNKARSVHPLAQAAYNSASAKQEKRMRAELSYLKALRAADLESQRRQNLGVVGRGMQDALNLAKGTGQEIARGAEAVGRGAATGAKAVGRGAATGAKAVGRGAATGAKAVGRGYRDAVDAIGSKLVGVYDDPQARAQAEKRTLRQAQRGSRDTRIRRLQEALNR